jgi:pilus assembly protein CpaB
MKQKMIPIISIAVGILAFLLTKQYIASQMNALEKFKEDILRQTKVVYVTGAANDLPRYATIGKEDLGFVNIEQRSASKAVPMDQAGSLIGRKLQMPVRKGEPIFWMEVEGGEATGLTLAPLIEKNRRAISIPVAGASAVSGMVQPGDYIDIVGTFTLPSKKTPGETELVTLTLLQYVTVLATGQKMAKSASDQRGAAAASYSSVTVEVTPAEAELLVFAQQVQGRLTLTLRNPSDTSDRNTAMNRDKAAPMEEVNFEHIEKELPIYHKWRQKEIRHTSGY